MNYIKIYVPYKQAYANKRRKESKKLIFHLNFNLNRTRNLELHDGVQNPIFSRNIYDATMNAHFKTVKCGSPIATRRLSSCDFKSACRNRNRSTHDNTRSTCDVFNTLNYRIQCINIDACKFDSNFCHDTQNRKCFLNLVLSYAILNVKKKSA